MNAAMKQGRAEMPKDLGAMQAATEAPTIEAVRLGKTYRTKSGEPVRALTDVSLAIAEGEFICIVGPSGCGKSTLMRLIGGLEPRDPDAGDLRLDGQQVAGPSPEVGVAFQSATLLPWLTIRQNVLLPLRVGRRRKRVADDKVLDYLRMVGLGGFENKYPYELSGGMQQRASIVRSLARDPRVLLMDEPFGALDALTRERMQSELQKLWAASRKTVVLITHSIGEAIFLADRVIVMSARPGRVLADLRVDLPRPRTHADTPSDPRYIELARHIRALLED